MASIQKIGTQTAIWSFLIGTILLFVYYQAGSSYAIPVSFAVISVLVIANLVIAALLIQKIFTDNSHARSYAKTIGLMLLNIPIALIYVYFVTILMNTLRISVTNETGQRIEDVTIFGGSTPITYAALGPQEKQNAWVEIQGDGAIWVEYRIGDKIQKEVVTSYTTTGMGTKMKFEIGKSNAIN